MRVDILEYVRCPVCGTTSFEIDILERDAYEIREGGLVCHNCGRRYEIHKGIVDLLPDPSPEVVSEQKGWVEMLGETTEDLVDTMLRLPYLQDDLWVTVSENFDQAISGVDLTGKRVLDIGAGRCWSTRRLLLGGASYAMGVDILKERFIGLETADIFIQHNTACFDRVVGDMNALPLRKGVFDVVFLTATLHHSSDLLKTLQQAAYVLAPNGTVIITNEPVRSVFQSEDLVGCVEIEHGINEHVYSILEYLRALKRAGLCSQMFFPRSIALKLDQSDMRAMQEMGRLGYHIISWLWRRKLAYQAVNGWLLPAAYIVASMPLVLHARKC